MGVMHVLMLTLLVFHNEYSCFMQVVFQLAHAPFDVCNYSVIQVIGENINFYFKFVNTTKKNWGREKSRSD